LENNVPHTAVLEQRNRKGFGEYWGIVEIKSSFFRDRTLSCSGSEGRGIPPQISTQVPTTFTVGNELGVFTNTVSVIA